MDTITKPLPVIALESARPTAEQTAEARVFGPARSAKPFVVAALALGGLVFFYFNWVAVLSVLLFGLVVLSVVLLPVALLIRIAVGNSGTTTGAILGSLVTAILLRRRRS